MANSTVKQALWAVCVAATLLGSAAPVAASAPMDMSKAFTKLTRGAVNILTGWVEIPKRILETSQVSGPASGFTWGTLRGIGYGFVRTAGGMYEVEFAIGEVQRLCYACFNVDRNAQVISKLFSDIPSLVPRFHSNCIEAEFATGNQEPTRSCADIEDPCAIRQLFDSTNPRDQRVCPRSLLCHTGDHLLEGLLFLCLMSPNSHRVSYGLSLCRRTIYMVTVDVGRFGWVGRFFHKP